METNHGERTQTISGGNGSPRHWYPRLDGLASPRTRQSQDTVLFPALHMIVPAKKVKELGEQFEKEEDRLFGDEGFEKTVDQVAAIEKQLGIYDLAQFTPK